MGAFSRRPWWTRPGPSMWCIFRATPVAGICTTSSWWARLENQHRPSASTVSTGARWQLVRFAARNWRLGGTDGFTSRGTDRSHWPRSASQCGTHARTRVERRLRPSGRSREILRTWMEAPWRRIPPTMSSSRGTLTALARAKVAVPSIYRGRQTMVRRSLPHLQRRMHPWAPVDAAACVRCSIAPERSTSSTVPPLMPGTAIPRG
jgi:hypothetical protein